MEGEQSTDNNMFLKFVLLLPQFESPEFLARVQAPAFNHLSMSSE